VVCLGDNSDDEHSETDVQDIDVSQAARNFSCQLIMSIRKGAGAAKWVGSVGMNGPVGMMDSMKEQVKEALVGHMGDTDDEDG
jgi:hypothetical protein